MLYDFGVLMLCRINVIQLICRNSVYISLQTPWISPHRPVSFFLVGEIIIVRCNIIRTIIETETHSKGKISTYVCLRGL